MNSSRVGKLTLRTGTSIGRAVELSQPQVILGRLASADVCIEHSNVSRKHASITQVGDQYELRDLGSSNGTFVNGQLVTGPAILSSGDVIRLGNEIELLFEQPEPVAIELPQVKPSPETVFDTGTRLEIPSKPPDLVVSIAGEMPATYSLVGDNTSIGRSKENDVVISSMIISRQQATIERVDGGYEISVATGATNPIVYQGRPIKDKRRLNHGDILRVGSDMPGMMVTITFEWPAQAALGQQLRTIDLGEKERLTIGRDPGNDVVLDQPTISRYHAQVTRVGRRYYVTDLHSANGTFVNDLRIEADTWLQANDTIRIGPYRFVLGQDQFVRYDETNGLRVESVGLNKWVRKKLNLLQDISLVFQPREFVVVVGQSGGGKSTLVDAIAGYRPATNGKVFVNGIDVYRNFDAVRNEIGYVPQRDIIHMELTVYQALEYAARLRMPRDTSKEERHKRIMEVLEDLDLTHRKDVQISGLSGGQQKRVSIGVELLTRPGLFFLDEPTSGLDPGTETSFMHLMRRLADQGRTIIMVTHATKNVMLADKVVFLARGGFVVWFGPPDEALAYFDQFRTERERRTRPMEFDQIYAILDDSSRGNAEEWAKRYQANPAYQKYIVEPLQNKAGQLSPADKAKTGERSVAKRARRGGRVSSLNQLIVLSARNLKIITRDRSSLILMLLAAPMVGLLDLVIAPMMNSSPYDIQVGNAKNGSITLFLLIIYCLLVGGLSQMREIVKETDIYKRERLVNLHILPYIVSKVWVAILLAFYQAAAYTIIHYIAFRMPGGTAEFGMVYVTLLLAVIAGMVGGLLASALAPAASSAPLIMILLIVPQIVLSGALAPVPSNVGFVASTRWGFETLIGITGMGADVSADPCWQLSKELRNAMTLEDKAAQGCKCMGVAVFDPNSCRFPGLGKYYQEEIDQVAPIEPAELGAQPSEPVIPPAPEPPEDKYDQVKMAQYLNALSDYQAQVDVIQEDYKSAMQVYQAQAEVYKNQMIDYQEALALYNIGRNSAVKGAEGLIESIREQFGWAWVNKNDPNIFYPWLFKEWLSQGAIIGVYFLIILVLIKRKDVK
ncbi:MAG: FHA domain-containing protein [Chloroflexi bacterium]|nr:FHA domain-containing protein [Chloroflexota bacterium]